MNWALYWFIFFLIELFIWSYVLYLHFEIKELEEKRKKPKLKSKVKVKVTEPPHEKTKREIMEG